MCFREDLDFRLGIKEMLRVVVGGFFVGVDYVLDCERARSWWLDTKGDGSGSKSNAAVD